MNLIRTWSLSLLATLSFSFLCLSLASTEERSDFQVISVTENFFRAVRVFWNPPKNQNLVKLKIFEKDQFLALESVQDDSSLTVTISLNAHTFHVYSLQGLLSQENAIATIEIPAQSEILIIPAYVVSMTGDEFHYKWVMPNTTDPITNIRLLWCNNVGTNLQICDDGIHGFTEVDPDATEMQLHHDQSVIMALQIDTSTSSSGIVLPKCISLQSEVGLLNDKPKLEGNSSHISIVWQLKCLEEGIVYGVTGYNLYYCRLQSGTSCVEPETKLTYKKDDLVLETAIDGLTPSTTYQITGTVVLGNGTESGRRELIYTTMPAPIVTTTRRYWRPPRRPHRINCGYRFESSYRWCRSHTPSYPYWN